MQTTTLPIQVSPPSPAPQRANAAAPADNAQFSQALSREMQQRQDSPAPAPARPKAAPAPASALAKPAGAKANDAKPASAKADDAKPASASADAAADEAQDDAADAAAITPVADLIALVASYNQATAPGAPANDPAAAEAATAAAAVAVAAGGTGKQLKADLNPAPAKAPALPAAGEGIAAAGKDAVPGIEGAARFSVREKLAGAALKETRSQAAEPALARPAADAKNLAAAPKADVADAAAAPVNPKAEPAAAPAPLHAEPAPLRLRDADVAILRDPAPAAPVSAPVQQASLAVAQAVNGVPADRIAARVGTPGWDNQVGQKIIWMVAGKEQSATLTLNPPDMGPMQVVLNVHNDQASVTFSAAQPEVRQALENAMPKLREMMSESGIALGNATVDAGTPDQRQAQQNEQARSQRAGGRFSDSGAVETPVVTPRAARSGGGAGLVDTFA